MSTIAAPWHKASFEQFLQVALPALLAEHLPLIGYQATATETYLYRLQLTLASASGDVTVTYTDLPQPDDEGVFVLDDRPYVIVPTASSDDLAHAEIACAGEQLLQVIREHLSYQAPAELQWTPELLHAWLPLDRWLREALNPEQDEQATMLLQPLNALNWLARQAHLRLLYVQERTRLFTPGHFGRTCPFETPEGPNIGRFLHIALGAEIRERKLVVVDDRPAATLGLSASMIPLLEHNHPQRLLMGANMQRQWLAPSEPESAYVQSGNEPAVANFWCGRNLLTALISWDLDTFDDAILISESCAQRLAYPHPIEPGDKLSNRHGSKGVVSRIVPDAEMPHLPDGTPVELVYNFINTHARLYFGQVREAVLGRIAHTTGEPLIAPPFEAPDEQQIYALLAEQHLPTDGMETLTAGRNGPPLARPSTVGWIYWGRLLHVARDKMYTSAQSGKGQLSDQLEYYALRDAQAFETILEQFNTLSTAHTTPLTERVAAARQADPPTPRFADLQRRLAALGIQMVLTEQEQLTFHLANPTGETLKLAHPVVHPWLHDQQLTQIGVSREWQHLPAYIALADVNTRLERMLASQAPSSLTQQAFAQLTARVQAFAEALLPPQQMHFRERVLSSARAVAAPGIGLHYDQLGLPEQIAWDLFAPWLVREEGEEAVQARSEQATAALDARMARSWILVHRAPSLGPHTFIACHPVRHTDRVVRLHPLVSRLLQADFDGDQVALYLPITPAAQRETGERLTLHAHLERDHALLNHLLPDREVLWGLAALALTPTGRDELKDILGPEHPVIDDLLTQERLATSLASSLQQRGVEGVLEILERLFRRGFAATQKTGASISPFIGTGTTLPAPPSDRSGAAWQIYMEELYEQLAAQKNYQQSALGPQLLAIKSGARGEIAQLAWLLAAHEPVNNVEGHPVALRHGYREGLPPEESYVVAIGARQTFANVQREIEQMTHEVLTRAGSRSFHVLARAMRARQRGIVFAHAASIGESDPLTDLDSRLFVGLPPRKA